MPIILNYVDKALIPMKGKTGKNNKSQKDLKYWPFSPAAETLIYMLIGALTTRAKAMSSQSKYQWNEIEWKIHRVFLCKEFFIVFY